MSRKAEKFAVVDIDIAQQTPQDYTGAAAPLHAPGAIALLVLPFLFFVVEGNVHGSNVEQWYIAANGCFLGMLGHELVLNPAYALLYFLAYPCGTSNEAGESLLGRKPGLSRSRTQ